MGLYEYAFCSIFFIQVLNFITGQLIPQEELKNVTSCGLPIDVTCGSNEIIAVHSLYFWYHVTCSGTCCNYDSSHFSAGADSGVIQAVRRKCSGENACSLVHHDGNRDFGSAGVHDPSYFVVKYYCILASRITSICSGETLTSAGEPVYLINDNYPSVTTGNSTCACSIEVFSCTSSINLYILDADLYLDETTCDQTIDFVDGTSTSLSVISCKSYYDNRIDENRFNTNYLKIDFIDNSEHNQEGYIFLAFGVSETVAFKLSCPYEKQYVCRDCGVPGPISHGKLKLVDSSNSSYGSLAKVSCDNGYESEDSTVSCLDTGQWESVACLLKDCGTPYDISNGTITPVINGSTTFGARANVICDEGFEIKGNCAVTQFQCGDGSCIDNSLWCDNFPNCDDMLDELLCEDQQSCLEGQMLCGTSCVDSQVGITCNDSGTTAAEANTGTISCLVIGKWEIVKCSAKDCGNPVEIQNGNITLTVIDMTTYQSTAAVTCDAGFVASVEMVSCQANGTWEIASCITDCGAPVNVTGATVTTSSNNLESSVATYICGDGYTHTSGDLQRTCTSDSTWNGTLPTCTPDCGTPPNSMGAEVTTSAGTLENSVATYVCQNGFTHTSGNLRRTCGADSIWNGTLPTCTSDCGDPENVTGATVTTSSNNLESSVATYICGEGYTHISGDLQRTCRSDSTWSGSLPTCIPDCGNPPNIPYGSITLLEDGNTTYNSTARVTCQEGYKAKKQMVTCKERGRWESSSCEPKEDTHDDKQQTEDGNASSTILVAVLVPIIVIGIILAICVIWRYRQRLCEIRSSKGHESISFKNEEVLPEDQGYQNLNISFVNEGNVSSDQQCQDPNVSSKNEDILPEIPEVQPCQDSKTDVQTNEIVPETQKCQESNVAVKTDEVLSEKQQCQESNVAVKTDEDLPEKQQFQESNVAVKTEDVLPEKQQSQESNVAVKTDEVLPEKDPNVDAMTENVLHEKQQGQDSDVSAPNDELPDNQQSQVSNVAGDSEEKEKPDQS